MSILSAKTYIPRILSRNYQGGKVLEIAAGRAEYRQLFQSYVGTDLPGHPYPGEGSLDAYCDARILPFCESIFDFAFIVAALHLIPTPERVIRSLYKLLQPGGTLMVFDYTRKTQKRLADSIFESSGVVQNYPFWNERELSALISDAGFDDIKRIVPNGTAVQAIRQLMGRDQRWLILKGIKL